MRLFSSCIPEQNVFYILIFVLMTVLLVLNNPLTYIYPVERPSINK
jgi:hypothetical protein